MIAAHSTAKENCVDLFSDRNKCAVPDTIRPPSNIENGKRLQVDWIKAHTAIRGAKLAKTTGISPTHGPADAHITSLRGDIASVSIRKPKECSFTVRHVTLQILNAIK